MILTPPHAALRRDRRGVAFLGDIRIVLGLILLIILAIVIGTGGLAIVFGVFFAGVIGVAVFLFVVGGALLLISIFGRVKTLLPISLIVMFAGLLLVIVDVLMRWL